MSIPASVKQLDESDTLFGKPASQETIVAECSRLRCIRTVEVQGALRFARNIDKLGYRALHAERHLILRDSRLCCRIAKFVVDPTVHAPELIKHHSANSLVDTAGIRQIQHRIALCAKRNARMF